MCAVKQDKKNKEDEHVCGEVCEVYSRCTGYYRPVANWNLGKQEEFKERKRFVVPTNYRPNCKGCGDN